MTKVVLEEPEWIDTEIHGELTLGGTGPNSDSDSERFARRASVGLPVVRPLTPDALTMDESERSFIEKSGARFYLVELACSIYPEGDEKLDMATLAIVLDEGGVAWSLAPLRLSTVRGSSGFELGGEISLGPALKLAGHWAPPADQKLCWVYALGERECDPEWRLRRQGPIDISGPHRFAMIARVDAEGDVGGSVGLTARFDRNGRAFRGRAQLSAREATFVLPGGRR